MIRKKSQQLRLGFDNSEVIPAQSPEVTAALRQLATGSVDDRGAIFTRPEVVEFILDLAGYTPDQPLHRRRLLEPAFGHGDFLLPSIERLLRAWRADRLPRHERLTLLERSLRGVELHEASFTQTRSRVEARLRDERFSSVEIERLLTAWLLHGDFLLTEQDPSFDFVVGNPPYVRQEKIPTALLREYRQRFQTLYDRADLYVPFIERSLSLLSPQGVLGLICADRWMKNRYGAPLRRLVHQGFRLRTYVDMVDTDAFQAEVSAYPAITIISREAAGPTRIARRPKVETRVLTTLAARLRDADVNVSKQTVEVVDVVRGDAPWILEASPETALVRRLEAAFPLLEDAGCRVGIGVATGADQVFIGPFERLDVEPSCKLPLVMTRDLREGRIEWRGLGVINPFRDDGRLVSLRDHPRLAAYLERHSAVIRKRHVAQSRPEAWYRTIDRITPSLTAIPKLLIPDIKGDAHIVYDEGHFYPHHNLYFITSTNWDLKALRAVLLSGLARLFISAYSIRMRGGYLRFQAQYLRRIRLPGWDQVEHSLRARLVHAAEANDQLACDAATCDMYGLTLAERKILTAPRI